MTQNQSYTESLLQSARQYCIDEGCQDTQTSCPEVFSGDVWKYCGSCLLSEVLRSFEITAKELEIQKKAADHWFTEAASSHNRAVKLEDRLSRLPQQIMNLARLSKDWAQTDLQNAYAEGHRDARHQAAEVATAALPWD